MAGPPQKFLESDTEKTEKLTRAQTSGILHAQVSPFLQRELW